MTVQKQGFWLIAGAIVLAVVAIVLWKARPCIWFRVWSARIELNGATSEAARLYHGPQGQLMVDLRIPHAPNLYVIRLSRQEVGVTTAYYFWFVSQVGAMAKNSSDPSINMMHDKYGYKAPELKVTERSASFRGLADENIRIDW